MCSLRQNTEWDLVLENIYSLFNCFIVFLNLVISIPYAHNRHNLEKGKNFGKETFLENICSRDKNFGLFVQ